VPRRRYAISKRVESVNYLVEEVTMFPDSKTLNVFEYEIRRFQFTDNADEFFDKRIPGVVERALTDQGKTLARSAPENDVDASPTQTRDRSNFVTCEAKDRGRDHGAFWEIEHVDCGVNGIDLYGRSDVEASLLEAKAKPPRA